MSMDNLLSGLIGALIGGLISGVFSIYAVNRADAHNRNTQNEEDEKAIKGLLQALHDELESVFTRYQETMGARIESLPDGQPLNLYFPIVNDFFTIYNANARLIGLINNNDLRRDLVKTYVLCKGLVDSYRMNNELLSKFEHWHLMALQTNAAAHQVAAQGAHNALKDYSAGLKKTHREVKECIGALLRKMHKEGVLNERP